MDGQQVENTASGKKDGLNRCTACGSTDVTLRPATGKLRCSFCRVEFEATVVNEMDDISLLTGETVGSGATNIIPDVKVILSFVCAACGSSVVIDTSEAMNARCHWCRHTLSVNEQVPNGAVPDMVLPFYLEKAAAEEKIREFVAKRQFFACPQFKKEFTTENVMGVYLPYMVVDVNGHARLSGQAEKKIRSYTINKRTFYDADVYDVVREFDILIDDLTIESSSGKLDQNVLVNTNNVINAIMPFDVEKCVAWDANFLKGYASEKRDVNIDGLREQLNLQKKDIARYQAKGTMEFYDRGARWDREDFEVKGSKWKAAYLPVWLYSYMEMRQDKKMLHYAAVNARTGAVMGSVPINKKRLMLVSIWVEIVGAVLGMAWFLSWLQVDTDGDNPALLGLLGLTPGFIFYWLMTNRYRNMSARHRHEKNTRAEIRNVRKEDNLVKREKRLSNARIVGANDSEVRGAVAGKGMNMMGEKIVKVLEVEGLVGKMGKWG